jgi:hypothetical protein
LAYIVKQLRSKAENAAIKKSKDEEAKRLLLEETELRGDTRDEIEHVTPLCEATIATLNAAYLAISATDWDFHNGNDKQEACRACTTAMVYARDTLSAICEPLQLLLWAVLELGRKAQYLGQSVIEFCQRFNASDARIDTVLVQRPTRTFRYRS